MEANVPRGSLMARRISVTHASLSCDKAKRSFTLAHATAGGTSDHHTSRAKCGLGLSSLVIAMIRSRGISTLFSDDPVSWFTDETVDDLLSRFGGALPKLAKIALAASRLGKTTR